MIHAHVRRLDPERVLFIDPQGSLTAGVLAAYLDRADRTPISGLNVALRAATPMTFVRALAVLDGFAAKVLLLPADIGEGAAEKLLTAFGPDVLLTSPPVESASPTSSQTSTQWVIATSGTTGVPKLVAHTFQALTRTAKTDCETGRLYRWAQLYDMARFAGLQVLLNSLLSGATLLLTSPQDGLAIRLAHLQAHGCNAISATPTLWRKILMTPGAESLDLRQITLGGETVDQTILTALRKRFPRARISHIYASTEAGAVFSVNDGLAGFPKEYLTRPPSGIELRVDSQGILFVRPAESAGFLNTGDLVKESNGRMYFLGRANGTINVGGNKVQPEEIETVLHAVPGVTLARVTARSSPIMGSLVVAEIQLDAGVTDLDEMKSRIMSHCARNLEDFKIPAVIRFRAQVEVGSSGKLSRR